MDVSGSHGNVIVERISVTYLYMYTCIYIELPKRGICCPRNERESDIKTDRDEGGIER